jgi:hypothetical protein
MAVSFGLVAIQPILPLGNELRGNGFRDFSHIHAIPFLDSFQAAGAIARKRVVGSVE